MEIYEIEQDFSHADASNVEESKSEAGSDNGLEGQNESVCSAASNVDSETRSPHERGSDLDDLSGKTSVKSDSYREEEVAESEYSDNNDNIYYEKEPYTHKEYLGEQKRDGCGCGHGHHDENEDEGEEERDDHHDEKEEHEDTGIKVDDGEPPENRYLAEKAKGVELFKEGDTDGAIKCWSRGLRALQFILDRKEEFESGATSNEEFKKKWDFFVKSYVEISSNMALGYLKKKKYGKCIKYSKDVLKYDKNNIKAHLRLTHSNVELGNFKRAKDWCDKGLAIYPGNVELKQLKRKVIMTEKKRDVDDKDKMKNIFDRMSHDPRSLVDPNPPLYVMIYEDIVEYLHYYATRLKDYLLGRIYSFKQWSLWPKFKKE